MAQTEDLGISFVHNIVARMGYFFKEQNKHDYGIDAHVETSDEKGRGSGRNIGLQIKSGESYIKLDKNGDINFYTDREHIDYWANYSLPVILLLYSPEKNWAWWCDVKEYLSRHPKTLTSAPYVIKIPIAATLTPKDKLSWEQIAINSSHSLDLSKKNYTILKKADVSTASFKRYSADILVGNYVNKDAIRLAIFQSVNYLKNVVEHSSDLQEKHWGNHPPQLIAVFVYFDTDDKHYTQWMARAIWRDNLEILQKQWKHINANDFTDDIEIEFVNEEKRKIFKDFLTSSESTKTHFVKKVNIWVPMSESLVLEAQELLASLTKKAVTQEIFEENMKHLALKFDIIINGYDDGTTAPAECHDAQLAFVQCVLSAYDVFIPFTDTGLKRLPNPTTRKTLAEQFLKTYFTNREKLKVEMRKLRFD